MTPLIVSSSQKITDPRFQTFKLAEIQNVKQTKLIYKYKHWTHTRNVLASSRARMTQSLTRNDTKLC